MKKIILASTLLLSAGFANAGGDAAAGEQKAAACIACHGTAGNSTISSNPILAGQHRSYLVQALNGYKDGSYVKIWNGLEDNQVLEGFIKTQASIDNLDVSTIDFEATVYKHLERHYPKQSATAVKQSA